MVHTWRLLGAAQYNRGQEAELWGTRGGGHVHPETLEARQNLYLGYIVTDTDAKAYTDLSSRTVLEATVRIKKATYLKACMEH